jgi:hypothetical protein
MTLVKKSLAAATALCLVGAPVAAQAATSNTKPAVSKVKRANVAAKKESKLGGGTGLLVAAAAAAAVVLGIVVLTDNPKSP